MGPVLCHCGLTQCHNGSVGLSVVLCTVLVVAGTAPALVKLHLVFGGFLSLQPVSGS